MLRRTIPTLFAMLLLIGLPITAYAGDEAPCKSTQAANELRSCDYCREIKRILSDPGMEGVDFQVTALKLGATVHMESTTDEGLLLLQDLVSSMWGETEVDDAAHVCDYCLKRREKLQHVLVDWTATNDGVQLVLISEEPSYAKWAVKDARATQGWVLSSAEH